MRRSIQAAFGTAVLSLCITHSVEAQQPKSPQPQKSAAQPSAAQQPSGAQSANQPSKEEVRYYKAGRAIAQAYNKQDFKLLRTVFSPKLAQELPEAKTNEYFTKLFSQLGTMKSLGKPMIGAKGAASMEGVYEKGKMNLILLLDSADRIAGIDLRPVKDSMSTAQNQQAAKPPVAQAKPGTTQPVPTQSAPTKQAPAQNIPAQNAVTKPAVAPTQAQTQPQQQSAQQSQSAKPMLYAMPVKGGWTVKSNELPGNNPGNEKRADRYALDLVMMKDGVTKNGDGKRNEDYYAFGQEVTAPQDGIVLEVIDGVHENPPGIPNPFSMLGNAVTIKTGEKETVILSHLKNGSIAVKRGDKVTKGQKIAVVGNTGLSLEPMLTFHVQSNPLMVAAEPVKPLIESATLVRNGKGERKTAYAPVRGDLISK